MDIRHPVPPALVFAWIGLASGCKYIGIDPDEIDDFGEDDTSEATTVVDTGDTETTGPGDTETTDPDDSDTETETGTETGDDTMFVPGTDFGVASECDPFEQDCPDGEKCVPYSSSGGNWDANKCVPVLGNGQAGDPCVYGGVVEATDDCDANTHCWDVMDVDGMDVGVCTPFCMGSADDPICPPDTSCLIANDGSITLCIATCDPVLQDCGVGLGCYWTDSEFFCIFTIQDTPLGEPCGFINDCTAGLTCLPAEALPNCESSTCCASWCSVSEMAPCPLMGTECVPFFEDGIGPPEYGDVGVCVLPSA
jgi:hypothetical protein